LEKYEEALAMDESVIGVHLNLAQVHYDLSRNFADTSKAHQEHIAAYARHMKFIRDNVDGYEEVLKLINIPIESSEGTRGDGWADVVSGYEDLKTRILGFFVDDSPVEYIWRLDDGSFFEFDEEKSILLNLRIDKEGLDPLKGDFFAEGNRYSSKRQEMVDLSGPSANMVLKIELVKTLKGPAIPIYNQYLLTLKNSSKKNETLDLIVIKYRAEPGISIIESKPTVDEQRSVTPDRKKPVASEEGVRVVSGGKRFGIEERHYLFWYN